MRLYAWSLATFHTVLFFAVLVMAVYLTGSLGQLLAALNTLIGTTIFVLFWLATWFCTRSALGRIFHSEGPPTSGIGGPEIKRALYLAPLWAGINGIFSLQVFLLGGLLALIGTLIANPALVASPFSLTGAFIEALTFGGFAEAFGIVPAFVVGALVGLVFVGIDGLLFAVAQSLGRLVDQLGRPPVRAGP